MHFSPFALARPVFLALTGLTALAVALGRAAPDESKSRHPAPVRYYGINWYHFQRNDVTPRFLDANTGEVIRGGLDESDHLEYLSCSPWQDAHGQGQVVGLWDDASSKDRERVGRGLGLALYTFPEGRVRDRVPLEKVPVCNPCWYPGTVPRLLFAAADGDLYRFSFTEGRSGKGGEALGDDSLRPRPLRWRTTPPAEGKFLIRDPQWPTDPRLKGKILVSLIFMEDEAGSLSDHSGSKVWWLELNSAGTEIERAGPVDLPSSESRERWPALGRTADGDLMLAYMVRGEDRAGWRLRLADMVIDAESGIPRAVRALPVAQSGAGVDGPAAFSTDGRWINLVTRPEGLAARVERFPLPRHKAASEPAPLLAGRPGP